MNLLGVLFLIATATALLALPRKYALMPLLIGACYMTLAQSVEIGPFRFTLLRLLILIGLIRVVLKKEWLAGGIVGLDKLVMVWGAWAITCSFFRENVSETLVNHLGHVFTTGGIYLLVRCFCTEYEDVVRCLKMAAVLLAPVALEMVSEQLTRHNMFSILGGVSEEPTIRKGRIRSQGPFAHAILAGTVGAVCAPLMIGLWRKHKQIAQLGLGACLLMVLASASSGPLLSLMFGLIAVGMWRFPKVAAKLPWVFFIFYVLLEIIMHAPAYYMIARVDVVGGSTGWHRAALIEAAIKHLNEWWFAGTDYTRHWMPYGVGWSDEHADITNHYLAQGVRGGLPLLLLFASFLVCGILYVKRALRENSDAESEDRFLIWCLGAALIAQAATCIAVAYFDQSILFLYLMLGISASLQSVRITESAEDEDTVDGEGTRRDGGEAPYSPADAGLA